MGGEEVNTCDCGGAKAGTTHAAWCSVNAPPAFPPPTPLLDQDVEDLKQLSGISSPVVKGEWYARYDQLPDSVSKELVGDLNDRMREWAEVRRAYRAVKRGQKK